MAVRKTLRKKRYNKKGGAPTRQLSKAELIAELKNKRAAETDPAKQSQLNFDISVADMAPDMSGTAPANGSTPPPLNLSKATNFFSGLFSGFTKAVANAVPPKGGKKTKRVPM